MKKIILLSLALVAGLFVLTNVTNAQSATPTLDLEITAVTGECRYGINLDLGDHPQSYDAFTMSGAFLSNHTSTTQWSCNDTAWKAPRSVQISSTDLVAGAYSIDSDYIEVMTAAWEKYAWGANFVGADWAFTARGTNLTTPAKLFEKTSAAGTVGEYGVDTVDLRVLVPANQEIWAYQSTITIAFPQM